DALAYFRIAQVRQMLALSAGPDSGLLYFDEIADASFRTYLSVHAEARKRTDVRAGIDPGIRDQRIRRHSDPFRQSRGFENRALADVAVFPHHGASGQPGK